MIGSRNSAAFPSRKAARSPTPRRPAFRANLHPLRRTVKRQDFVAGKAPAYSDYIAFGEIQWAQTISDFEVLAPDDPVFAWRGRMLDLFQGFARCAPACGA
jgi:hypothetical protein